MQNLILLDKEETWTSQVVDYLNNHYNTFLSWELEEDSKVSSYVYDNLIDGLKNILRTNYVLHGYHCTRLTEDEIHFILANGMQLPDQNMLYKRIDLIEKAGLINSYISERLKSNNQADNPNRAGMLWFCFFPPYHAEQAGIERFFRSWGGESLYGCHENDPVSGHVLNMIGTPCIIEAYIPVKSLNTHSFLESKIIRRFLINRGLKTGESIEHEGCVLEAIPSQNIKKVIKFPECEFFDLTKCDQWNSKLS